MAVLIFSRFASNGNPPPGADAPVTEASLNAFGNAVASVSAYSNAVRFTELAVVPGSEPAWYAALNGNLTNMKTHAQAWIDTIGPSMTAIPQAIINFGDTFEGQYATIVALLTAIGSGTPTKQQKKDLLTEMNALLVALEAQRQTIVDANGRLIQFNDNLSADHQALTTGAASITNAIASDNTDITLVNLAMKNLQADIDAMNQVVKWSAVGLGASIFVGIVGVVVAFVTFGAGALIVAGAVVGAGLSIAGLAVAETRIKDDTAALQQKTQQLSDDHRQIAVLNSVANAVDSLAQKNAAAGSAMDVVLSDWATLSAKLKAVIDDLDQAKGDIGSILDLGDMATTRTAWQQLTDFATNMQTSLASITVEKPVTVKPAA